MMRIEDFVNIVKLGPSGHATAEDATRLLTQFIKELKKYSAADLEAVHSGFEFAKHSHGLAVVLSAKAANPACPLPQTLQQIEAFLAACSNTTNLPRTLDAHQISVLCQHLADRLVQDKCPRLGIDLMLRAIGVVSETNQQLTEIHYLLLWLCLESKHYKPAFDMLEGHLYEVYPPKNFDLHACIMYYYYGSVILAAHKFFISALHYISTIFHIPGVALSGSQTAVDAYKKYILLAILAKDQGLGFSRAFAAQIETHLRKSLGPYLLLQDQFNSDRFDARALDEIVEKNGVTFAQDRNLSLIQHVVKRYRTKELLKFAKVFENLQVAVVMERLGLSDLDALESQLLDMYAYSDQVGRLDESLGAVFFTKKTNLTSAEQVVEAVQTSVGDMQNVVEILTAVEAEILCDPEFLRKTMQGADAGGGAGSMSREEVLAIAEALGSSSNGGIAGGMAGSRSGRRAM